MRFAVESWDPGYGVSADETSMTDPGQSVNAAVEIDLEHWAPITPASIDSAGVIWFIDGVRRIDARLWITDITEDGEYATTAQPGVCATVAAGAVRCTGEHAHLVGATVERALYSAAPSASDLVTEHGTYGLRAITDPSAGDAPLGDEAMFLAVHTHMTAVETGLELDLDGDDLVVFDGPLRGREMAAGVGFVKTHNVRYLAPAQHAVIGTLKPGQRTPLFQIGDGGFSKWSWYLRLPGPVAHPMSGVVRLELSGMGTSEQAAARADLVSASLPRFASHEHKDSRAPQNLYPIAGLERELRRRLGDPYLMERALRRAQGVHSG